MEGDVVAKAGLAKFHREFPENKAEAVWVLGPLGAVSLTIYRYDELASIITRTTMGSVDRHSPKPLYDDEEWGDSCMQEHCLYLEGAPCYCDGSMLAADALIEMWDNGQHDEVYIALAAHYVGWLMERE